MHIYKCKRNSPQTHQNYNSAFDFLLASTWYLLTDTHTSDAANGGAIFSNGYFKSCISPSCIRPTEMRLPPHTMNSVTIHCWCSSSWQQAKKAELPPQAAQFFFRHFFRHFTHRQRRIAGSIFSHKGIIEEISWGLSGIIWGLSPMTSLELLWNRIGTGLELVPIGSNYTFYWWKSPIKKCLPLKIFSCMQPTKHQSMDSQG